MATFYLNHGYVRFRIDSVEATLTSDKEQVYVVIKLTEGRRYRIKGFEFSGKTIVPPNHLRKIVQITPNQYYSQKQVQASVDEVMTALGDKGYAFATVGIKPKFDDEKHTVYLDFHIVPGKRVYVRRLNFIGHLKTSSVVLRRELRQLEASLYSTTQLKESVRRLKLLGYLKDIGLKVNPVPNTADQVDIDMHVVEAPSAKALVGVGYGTDGFIVNASLDQPNFLGSGRSLNISFDSSSYSKLYSVSYFNPYYTTDGIGRGFNVYYQRITPGKLNITNYASNNYGGALIYTISVREDDTLHAEFGYNNTAIILGSGPSAQLTNFITANGSRFSEFSSSLGWSHNGLDQAIFPTNGVKHEITAKLWLPLGAGNLKYYTLGYYGRAYYPISKEFIVKVGANLGFGGGIGSTPALPFFRNYYAGGAGSVRGYVANTLGPKDTNGSSLGGNFLVTGSAALIFPNYLSENLRTSAFIDAGNVYNTGGVISSPGQSYSTIRFATGLEINWRSPLGPLAFSFAKAINAQSGDDLRVFQFSVGTTF